MSSDFIYMRNGGVHDAYSNKVKWDIVKQLEGYKPELPMKEFNSELFMNLGAGLKMLEYIKSVGVLRHQKELIYTDQEYFYDLYEVKVPKMYIAIASVESSDEDEDDEWSDEDDGWSDEDRWAPNVSVFCRDEPEALKIVEEIKRMMREGVYEHEPSGELYILGRSGQSFSFIEINDYTDSLNRENYSPENIEKYDYISDIINGGEKNAGKLTILSGEPGTGKSYFCRGLINQLKAKCVIFPVALLGALGEPSLITFFAEEKDEDVPYLLIIEDGDDCLVKRERGNSHIADILNLGDGLIGESLNMYIIVTTNKDKLDIDGAITRPGRLLEFIEFDTLSVDQCNAIYQRETDSKESPFDEPATLAKVYAKSAKRKTDLIKKKTKVKIGF